MGRKKEWLTPEERAEIARIQNDALLDEARQKAAGKIELAIKYQPSPSAVSHGFTGPDPERKGQPTFYIVGGNDKVMQLARDLYVRDGNLTPEDAWDKADDFYNRAIVHSMMREREAEAALAAANPEPEPQQEVQMSEGGIILL